MQGNESPEACPETSIGSGLPMKCCMPIGGGKKNQQSKQTSNDTSGSVSNGTTGGTDAAPPTPQGGIEMQACESTGDCSIDAIVQKGVSFARFIMGLAGALFLLVLVYGGAMYVLSFGKSSWVDKGKKAMTQAVIGIILVMGAYTIVFYVADSLGYKVPNTSGGSGAQGGPKGVCGQAKGTEGRTCMDVNKEGKGKDCTPGYCPGKDNIRCCK